MARLAFVTTNQGKVDFLRIVLEPLIAEGKIGGVDMAPDVELTEIQADTVTDICRAKAAEAFQLLGRPAIVQDSGFSIAALNGFPGPYTKYVLGTLGVDGLLKLMEGQTDRRCGFPACVGYVDDSGEVRVFQEPQVYYGTMRHARASKLEGSVVGMAYGDLASALFEIFVPDDSPPGCEGLTLSEMSKDQLTTYRRSRNSAFKAFAEWWREHS